MRTEASLSQRAVVSDEGPGSGPGLQPLREREQGLLAVDDIQVVDVGLQLLLLLRAHVTSELVCPAVPQGPDSVCNHVLEDRSGNRAMKAAEPRQGAPLTLWDKAELHLELERTVIDCVKLELSTCVECESEKQ